VGDSADMTDHRFRGGGGGESTHTQTQHGQTHSRNNSMAKSSIYQPQIRPFALLLFDFFHNLPLECLDLPVL
jgi:hypothetical protein